MNTLLEFLTKLSKPGCVVRAVGIADTPTREGRYYQLVVGLAVRTYFIGIDPSLPKAAQDLFTETVG